MISFIILAPFCLLHAFIVSDSHFDLTEHLRGKLAYCGAKIVGGLSGVEIEDVEEILMFKIVIGVAAAAGVKCIGDADCGCISEGRSDVVLIILHQKGILNDVDDVLSEVIPILRSQLTGNLLQLGFQAVVSGRYAVGLLQRLHNRLAVLVLHRPQFHRAGVSATAGVSHIENIAQAGLIAVVHNQSNALGTTLDIAAHPLIPEVILGTGRGLRSLLVNHQLLMVGVLVEPCCGG
ncbi:MAG: hypothetical protein ACLRQ4_11325 [Neglectibacter timonensis]